MKNSISKEFIESAVTISEVLHVVQKQVFSLSGELIRYEGYVKDDRIPAAWDKRGRLIRIDSVLPSADDINKYSLVVKQSIG